MNEQRKGVFQMVGAAMWKERELRAKYVQGTCRLVAFDDRGVLTST